MKIYRIPDQTDFYKIFEQDIIKAVRVVIISPYLSMDTIAFWRKLSKVEEPKNFCIIYDIGSEEGQINGIIGKPQPTIQSQIDWKQYDHLHAKVYYFEFENGSFSFYHGSANFTGRGFGEGTKSTKFNVEIMSRIDNIDLQDQIIDIVNHFVESARPSEPKFIDGEWTYTPVEEPNDKSMEYKLILERIKPDNKFKVAKAGDLPEFEKEPLNFFKGLFKSNNNRYIKMHTTNNCEEVDFSLSRQELKWFLGNFYRNNCKLVRRTLYLVVKFDGSWDGKLIVQQIQPIQLFNLLSRSNHTKKLDININKLSINITVVMKDGEYFIKRYSKTIHIPMSQVTTYDSIQ